MPASEHKEFDHITTLSNEIRRGETSDEWVLDPNTWLEKTLSWTGGLALIPGAIILASSLWSPNQTLELSTIYGVSGLAAAGLCLLLVRLGLDDHYILDLKVKEVYFVRSLFGICWKRPVYRFDDLAGFLVNGRKHTSRSESHTSTPEWGTGRKRAATWWEYALKLVPRSGLPMTVIDYQRRDHGDLVSAGKVLPLERSWPKSSEYPYWPATQSSA